jgi:SRSO17 transposase
MEARDAWRQSPLLDDGPMAPEIFEQVMPRLHPFMEPFGRIFQGQAAAQHAQTSVCGLLSNGERKHIASIAYRCGQSRLPLQSCIGWAAWAEAPLQAELRRQVKTPLGQGEGGVVCDPAGCPQAGRESVGVARQWGGRLGKVEHCQVALSLG